MDTLHSSLLENTKPFQEMLTKEEFLSHLYEQYENPLEAEAVLDGEYAKYHLEAYSPPMPDALPEPIKLLTSRVPDHLKPAVAMSVFPPLGAHYRDTRFHYIDNRDYEPISRSATRRTASATVRGRPSASASVPTAPTPSAPRTW